MMGKITEGAILKLANQMPASWSPEYRVQVAVSALSQNAAWAARSAASRGAAYDSAQPPKGGTSMPIPQTPSARVRDNARMRTSRDQDPSLMLRPGNGIDQSYGIEDNLDADSLLQLVGIMLTRLRATGNGSLEDFLNGLSDLLTAHVGSAVIGQENPELDENAELEITPSPEDMEPRGADRGMRSGMRMRAHDRRRAQDKVMAAARSLRHQTFVQRYPDAKKISVLG